MGNLTAVITPPFRPTPLWSIMMRKNEEASVTRRREEREEGWEFLLVGFG